MANRIKGITVEIGGDTTKLSKAGRCQQGHQGHADTVERCPETVETRSFQHGTALAEA